MCLFFGRRRYQNAMTDEYRAALKQLRQQQSKLYRGVRAAVIFMAIMAAVFMALCFAVKSLRVPFLFKFCLVVFALCLGGAACLPWITQFERDRRRKARGEEVANWRFYIAYGFFAFIGVCTLLWVIAVFIIGGNIIENILNSTGAEISSGEFTLLRVAIFLSLQAVVGSVVATGILRHGKRYLVPHCIMYVALGYLDIYLSWMALGITVKGIEENTFPPISVTFLWVLAIMTGVAFLIAAFLLNAQTRRKEIELLMKGDVKALTEGDVDLIDAQASTANMYRSEDESKAAPAPERSVEEQLAKLQELLDKGIITEEEYAEKRKDIIAKM